MNTSAKPFMSMDPSLKSKVLYILSKASLISIILLFSLRIPLHNSFKTEYLVLMPLLYFLFCAPYKKLKIPLYLLFLVSILAYISWITTVDLLPDLAGDDPVVDRMAKKFLFIIVAVALMGNLRFIYLSFIAYIFSLFLLPFASGTGLSELIEGFNGRRVDFNFINAQHTALVFGAGLLGLLVYSKRIWYGQSCIMKCFWLLSIIYVFYGVWITQTRGIWLGIAIAIFAIIVMYFRGQSLWKLALYPLLVLSICIALIYVSPVGNKIYSEANRLNVESIEHIPESSVGKRVKSWVASYEWFLEKPWVGYGREAGRIVLRNSAYLEGSHAATFSHFHSSYVELIMGYGILSAIALLFLAIWLGIKLQALYRNGSIPEDLYIFFYGFLVFWLFVNIFESYFFYMSGSFLFNMVVGCMLSLILYSEPINPSNKVLSDSTG